jgi:hypothetical protein
LHSAMDLSQLTQKIKKTIAGMREQVPEKETTGSGWVFVRVETLELHVARFKPLKGSSWFDLPQKLKLKKAIINVKNNNEQCFKWAVLSAVFPPIH